MHILLQCVHGLSRGERDSEAEPAPGVKRAEGNDRFKDGGLRLRLPLKGVDLPEPRDYRLITTDRLTFFAATLKAHTDTGDEEQL